MGKTTTNGSVFFDTLTVNTIQSYTSELNISTLSNGITLNNTPLQSVSGSHLLLQAPSGYDIVCNKSILPNAQEVHTLALDTTRWKGVYTNELPAVDIYKITCFISTDFVLILGPNNTNSVLPLSTVDNVDWAYIDGPNLYCDAPYRGYYLVSYLVLWQPGVGGVSGTDVTIACRLSRPGYEFITDQVLITDDSDFSRRLSGNWVVYCDQPDTNISFVGQKDSGLSTPFQIKANIVALQLT